MVERRHWTEDELLVLTSIFFSGEFSIGDDAQKECQLIADAFSRTPSSVDRQWRNIADVLKEKPGVHVGKLVYQAVETYLDNPAGVKSVALEICRQKQWGLLDLVAAGETDANFAPAPAPVQDALRSWFTANKPSLEYKIFNSGSHGYHLEQRISLSERRQALLTISCALIGSIRSELVEIAAMPEDFSKVLADLVAANQVKVMPTGRLTLQASKKHVVCSQPFQINVRLIELKA